ncbi:hypothetical protein [Haladaptatus sp. CMAA 1911]|uniref:hypothetical protein n=1 Tax=unclassified Haladaptatus TaxID=2622732 RepID=UPI003754B308
MMEKYNRYHVTLATDFPKSLKRLFLHIRNANILYHKFCYGKSEYKDGINIHSKDWDNLLLLDACRYDMFEQHVNLPGELSREKSKGSMTAQFLEANFDGRDATDTVYITANPMHRRIENTCEFRFHKVVDVWNEAGWDENEATVLPETVYDYALRANEEYPNKRLLIHFMQPHFPFVGTDTEFDKQVPDQTTEEVPFWLQLRSGTLNIPSEVIWDAYNRNLNVIVPTLSNLGNKLTGKTVVSSDHGNMVGERSSPIPIPDWGHPRGLYTPELIDIPWLVLNFDNRKKVTYDPPVSDDKEVANNVVQNRLRDLGYTE